MSLYNNIPIYFAIEVFIKIFQHNIPNIQSEKFSHL